MVAALLMVLVVFQVGQRPGSAVSAPAAESEKLAETDTGLNLNSTSAPESVGTNSVEPVISSLGGSFNGSVESFGGPPAPTISFSGTPVPNSQFSLTNENLSVRTPAGIYFVNISRPEALTLHDLSGRLLVQDSYFSLEADGALFCTSNGEIDKMGENALVVRYDIVSPENSSVKIAKMEAAIDFSRVHAPKITVKVLEIAPSVVDWRVVWVIEPAHGALINLPGIQSSAPLGVFNGAVISAPDQSVSLRVEDSLTPGEFRADWSDEKEGSLSVRALDSGHALQVTFSAGKAYIDPTLVATTSSTSPTDLSCQRKVVWYDGYYWVFYDRGDTICYKRSADGQSWSSEYALPEGTALAAGLGFDVYARDGKIGVGWIDSAKTNTYFKAGTFLGSKIQWNARSFVVQGLGACFAPVSVTIGTDGAYDVFVQWRMIPGYYCWSVFRSFDGLAPWTSIGPALNYAYSNSNTWNVILPFGNGDLALLETSQDYTNVRVRYWLSEYGVSSGWTNPTEYTVGMASGAKGDKFSAIIALDGVIHIAMKDTSSYLKYAYIHPSGTMSSLGLTATAIYGYPSISLDENNDLHIFWLDSSTVIRHIQKTGPYIDAWSAIDTFYTSGTAMKGLTSWVNPVGTHTLVWTALTTPYSVMFGSIPLPYGTPGAAAEPWNRDGLSPYGTYFSTFMDYLSPGSGLLTLLETDASIPGRGVDLSISRIYQQPRYFRTSDGQPYMSFAYPYSDLGPGWSLDLPWMDRNYVYTGNGQRFIIQWGNNGNDHEFENHDDVHFVLRDVTKIAHGRAFQYFELIMASGMRYSFDHGDYRITDFGDLRGYDPEARDYTPSYNMITVYYDYVNNRITSLEEYDLGRAITFAYNANGMLQTITRPDTETITFGYTSIGGKYMLTSVTDPKSRVTTFAYTSYGSYPYNYLLTSIQFPTGAKNMYTYAQDSSVGTEVRAWLVTQQKVVDAATSARIRQTDYDYKVVSGKVRFVNATDSNEAGVVQGRTESVFVSDLKYSSQTSKDASGVQLSKKVTWYDQAGQPMRVDTYKGSSQSINYSEYASYDDWGNVVFSKNAMGYESYNSYANTKTQNSFQGGSLLKRTTSGKIFYDSFDDWDISDWSRYTENAWIGLVATFDAPNAPALALGRGDAPSTCVAYHAIPAQSADFVMQLSWWTSSFERSYILGRSGTTSRLNFSGASGSFQYYNSSSGSWVAVGSYVYYTWYDIGFVVHFSANKYDIYIDGVLAKRGATLIGSGAIDSIRFQEGDAGQGGATTVIDSIRLYKSLTVTVSMGSGYVAELYDAKGKLLDRSKTGSLSLASPPQNFPPGYIKISKIGDYSFETPVMDIWGGDAYSLSQGTRSSNIGKTTSGFLRYTGYCGDEYPFPGTTINYPRWVNDPDYAANGQWYHETTFDWRDRYYGFESSGSVMSVDCTDALVQYVWLTEGQIPTEIMVQYKIGSNWYRAYWGGGPTGQNLISTDPRSAYLQFRVGDVPQTTGQWIQLTVLASDFGFSSGNYGVYGVLYGLYGGTARWDFTSVEYRGVNVYNLAAGNEVKLSLDSAPDWSISKSATDIPGVTDDAYWLTSEYTAAKSYSSTQSFGLSFANAPSGYDTGSAGAAKVCGINPVSTLSVKMYVESYSHNNDVYWDTMDSGIRMRLYDVNNVNYATYTYWLACWYHQYDYKDPPTNTIRIYGKPTLGVWLDVTRNPSSDWTIDWSRCSQVMFELYVFVSGAWGDNFKVYFDDFTVSPSSSIKTVDGFDGKVDLLWTAGGTYVTLAPWLVGLRTYPTTGHFEVSNGGTLLYRGPTTNEIYNWDYYTYSAPKFYPNNVKSAIHNALVGSMEYQDSAGTVSQETYVKYDSDGNAVETKSNLGSGWV